MTLLVPIVPSLNSHLPCQCCAKPLYQCALHQQRPLLLDFSSTVLRGTCEQSELGCYCELLNTD